MDVAVSVIMTVYNTERYLKAAIDSILEQTYPHFELIIVDDASTDESRSVISKYRDKRIVQVMNHKNLGAAASSNIGLGLARGSYIARMDSDDISEPTRLEKQVAYLVKNRSISAVGGWIELFGEENTVYKYSDDPSYNLSYLLFNPSVAHSALMIRKSVLDENKIKYNTAFKSAIDYELYSQFPPHALFGNLQEVVHYYRKHSTQMSTARKVEQQNHADTVRSFFLSRLGILPSEDEMKLHSEISTRNISGGIERLQDAHRWLVRLQQANLVKKAYEPYSLNQVFAKVWHSVCHRFSVRGSRVWNVYFASEFSRSYHLPEYNVDCDRLLADLLKADATRVAVFGSGRMGSFLASLLRSNDIEVICFLDNNESLQDTSSDDIEIRSVAWLKRKEFRKYHIISSIIGDHDQTIEQQLTKELGEKLIFWNWKKYLESKGGV